MLCWCCGSLSAPSRFNVFCSVYLWTLWSLNMRPLTDTSTQSYCYHLWHAMVAANIPHSGHCRYACLHLPPCWLLLRAHWISNSSHPFLTCATNFNSLSLLTSADKLRCMSTTYTSEPFRNRPDISLSREAVQSSILDGSDHTVTEMLT